MSTNIPAVQIPYIKHGLLIDITVNDTTYFLSNLYKPVTYNGNIYNQLGPLLNLSEIQDDLRATNNQLTLSLVGVPSEISYETDFMSLVLNSNVKGSQVKVYRAFFNGADQLSSVFLRFNGYVSNFNLSETWDQDVRLSTNAVALQCSSVYAIMERQYTGRRTNNGDQQFWYPGDTGMYRVKIISDSSFDFGKKYEGGSSSSSGGGGGNTTTVVE
jgi:hypothetical protein